MTKHLSVILICLSVAACAQAYKLEIQQGNVITDGQVSQLKQNMTTREVRHLLGTPLIIDPFHKNRWDYYYSKHQGSEQLEKQKRISLVFENDRLIRVDGNVEPTIKGIKPSLGNLDNQTITTGKKHTAPTQKKPGLLKRTMDKIRRKDK